MARNLRKRDEVEAYADDIDYKNVDKLLRYVMETGRIIPSRITGTSTRKQRALSKAIKLARFLALLPYSDQHK